MKSLRVTRALTLYALPILLALSTPTHAETFRCTRGDTGCLIASIAKSNANGPAHDYLYLERGSYFLNSVDNVEQTSPDGDPNGLPVVTGALTIVGAGQGVTLIARDENFKQHLRLFSVASTGGLTIAYTTVSHGTLGIAQGRNGGCLVNRGSVLLYHSTVRECTAWLGGAIFNGGQLTLESATILGNRADIGGGGIASSGSTRISRSWIGENTARDDGGILCYGNATLTIERSVVDSNDTSVVQPFQGAGGIGISCSVDITNSLVSNNTSYTVGGGMKVTNGSLTMKNSTIWGNATIQQGGGIAAGFNAVVDLQGVAVLFNKASAELNAVGRGMHTKGGGLAIAPTADVTIENSWILWNEADEGADCTGELAMEGWNVVGDPGRFTTQDADPCASAGVQ